MLQAYLLAGSADSPLTRRCIAIDSSLCQLSSRLSRTITCAMSKSTFGRDKMVATTSERLQSPFLKAYINALRSYLAPESDLSAAGKAIFVSTNLQRGIPIKTFAEYINVRLYSIADSVQSGGPVFSEAEASYVDFLKE